MSNALARTDSDAGQRLAEKLLRLNDSLSRLEWFNMNLLMSVAVGGIAPRGGLPADGVRLDAWNAGLQVLGEMHPSGLRLVGRAPFMTDAVLGELQAEAAAQARISHRTGAQELSPGGPRAVALSSDPAVIDHLSEAVGHRVAPTEIGSYLYYNRAGDHLYPHVDTDIFSVNLITMVEHAVPAGMQIEKGSALTIFTPGNELRRVPLKAGESAVLLASGTVHGRETIAAGESVTILTIGFRYQDI
jgi:hypothetical protein